MQNEDGIDDDEKFIFIPRKGLLIMFIKRLYEQSNVKKICKGDYMVVPVSRFDDWCHDMGVILGDSIEDLLDQ